MFHNKEFGLLFKRLRLRAGIATLTELGKLLASKGFIYEDSSLSHWQNGRKVPKKRELLLALASIFVDNNLYISIDELNRFFESANQGYLTEKEIVMLNIKNFL